MGRYERGDVVKLKDSGKAVVVLEVYPEDTGVWALYRNSYGYISARGYNRIFLGEVTGHISLAGIEEVLGVK